MAITTQEKRQSALSAGFPWSRGVFPRATPTEGWRMSVGHAYGGNALSPDVQPGTDFIDQTSNILRARTRDSAILRARTRVSTITRSVDKDVER